MCVGAKKVKFKTAYVTIGLVVVLVAIAFFVYNFQTSVFQAEESYYKIQLDNISAQQASSAVNFFNARYSYIESLALVLSMKGGLSDYDSTMLLTTLPIENEVDELFVADMKGSYMIPGSKPGNCSAFDFFKRAASGEMHVSEIVKLDVNGPEKLAIATPIFRSDRVASVLVGLYSLDYITDNAFMESYFGEGRTFVWNSDGKFFVKPEEIQTTLMYDDFYEYAKALHYASPYSLEKLRSDIDEGVSGWLVYNSDKGMPRYAAYRPLGVNDWYLMSVMPSEVITSRTETVNSIGTELVVKFSLLLLAIVAVIVVYYKKYSRTLSIGLDRYRILVEQMTNTVFGYDPETDTLEFDETAKPFTELPRVIHNPIEYIRQNIPVHKGDIPALSCMLADVVGGITPPALDFRIVNKSGGIYWMRVSLNPVFGEDGRVVYAMGSMNDVTIEKNSQFEHQRKAERDSLTKLYNREYCTLRVNKVLADRREMNKLHAFIMLDIDNFKSINDTYGHQSGDMLLAGMSERALKLFRNTDIVSRIGGDEFVFFLTDIASEETAKQKASDLLRIIREAAADCVPPLDVTCSIGVAFADGATTCFNDLYQAADAAMYKTKAQGKNRYVVHDETDK